jgi:hypothetical protein
MPLFDVRRMSGLPCPTNPHQPIIGQIFIHLRPSYARSTKTVLYAEIARRLSDIAGKNPPWTWRYVQGIQSGTVQPSHHVNHAARILLARLIDAVDVPLYSNFETIKIHAPIGAVTPGTWIIGKSRPCANPTCTIHFVPLVPWQKFCPYHKRR